MGALRKCMALEMHKSNGKPQHRALKKDRRRLPGPRRAATALCAGAVQPAIRGMRVPSRKEGKRTGEIRRASSSEHQPADRAQRCL